MSLPRLLLGLAQPGYERQVLTLAQRIEAMLGEAAFADADPADVSARLGQAFATGLPGPQRLQLAADLLALSWWCGLEVDAAAYGAIGRAVRQQSDAVWKDLAQVRLGPDAPAPRVHNLFVGELLGPLHSPSRGAVDYAAVLGADPGVARIDIYHGGAPGVAMIDYLRARLAGCADRVRLTSTDDPDFPVVLAERGLAVNHVWCERPMALHLGLAARLGPMLMFTCGDEPPFQAADVYWYFHPAVYIRTAWAAKGVPDDLAARYVRCRAGPNNDALGRPARWTKAPLGLTEDRVLLVTVGNRLGVDLDETFFRGLEAILAAHPQAHWMAVGPLPEPILNACRIVLGPQFSHRPYEPELPSLMTAADLFVNPFRRGGGDSAMRALSGGAVVLARGDRGDVGAFVPDAHRATGATDFFTRLDSLIAQPALRDAWRSQQAVKCNELVDQALFAEELRQMTALAWERYRARTLAHSDASTDRWATAAG